MTSHRRYTYIWWMAWRNFSMRRNKSGLSFMTTVSIAGVSVGVAALIVVLSVMGGFEADLRRKMLVGEPQLKIIAEHATGGFGLREHPVEEFERMFPEATAVEPFVEADVVLKRKAYLVPVTMIGIDPKKEGALWGFGGAAFLEGELRDLEALPPAQVDRGVSRPGLPMIMLGDQLAQALGADVGDEITAISPQTNVGSLLGGGTLSMTFVLGGKFSTGIFNNDSRWAVVHMRDGRKFLPDYDESLDRDEFVTGVGLDFPDPFKVDMYAARVKKSSGLQTLTWQVVNKSLLFALKLEKFAMGSILMLIVVVAAFSISGTMMMTVFHKRGQVSLLRSLGMSKGDIARLYLVHGFTIGTVGITLGLALGLSVCLFISWGKFIPLPPGVYILKALPVRFLPFDYMIICAVAWVFSLVAATYPALTAARQDPSLGLRYE